MERSGRGEVAGSAWDLARESGCRGGKPTRKLDHVEDTNTHRNV